MADIQLPSANGQSVVTAERPAWPAALAGGVHPDLPSADAAGGRTAAGGRAWHSVRSGATDPARVVRPPQLMGTVKAPHRSPTAPRERDWDWDGTDKLNQLIERGWETVANAHAWHDTAADPEHDPPQEKGAYKLPHHELIDGRLHVVWRGVVAAMTVVNGARGGVDISDGDRRKAWEHLAVHYAEFGEDPPEFNA